jgi:hypothetical protein
MDPDRWRRLGALPGWSWDVRSDQWEKGFTHLRAFSDRKGHCQVRRGFKTDDGYALGEWVNNQRKAKDKLDPDRRRRLGALRGWFWDASADRWEKRFCHLTEFAEREKHCEVPFRYKTDDGFRLDLWLGRQRKAKDKLNLDRRKRLEALPGWVWQIGK